MCGQFNLQINSIIDECLKHNESEKFNVFGSIAKGSLIPGDLDLVVDLKDSPYSSDLVFKFNNLLKLGHRSFFGIDGLLDPFLLFKDCLLVRNDYSVQWIPAKNSRKLIKAMKSDMILLKNIKKLPIQDNQWAPK